MLPYGTFAPQEQLKAPTPFHRIIIPSQKISEMTCPISHETISGNPPEKFVIFVDGAVYNKKALLRWLQCHGTAPISNEPLLYYEKKYRLAASEETQRIKKQYRNFTLQASGLITISLSSITGLALVATYPIHSTHSISPKTVNAVLIGALFLLFLVSTAYLCCSVRPPAKRSIPRPIPEDELLTEDSCAQAFDKVQQKFQRYMLAFDSSYYAPQELQEAIPLQP